MEYAQFGSLAEHAARGLVAAGLATKAHLPEPLLELVRLRASLQNGCHFCIALHTDRLQHLGVPAERISALSAWRDASLFDQRERAALALCDAMTRLEPAGVASAVYASAAACFSAVEMAALVTAIAVINAWNRISITFEFSPESAVPKSVA